MTHPKEDGFSITHRDAIADIRHCIAVAAQSQPDWREVWEDALKALITTEGLGSFSQAKIPTEGQPTSNSHIQTGDKNDRP